MAAVSPVTFQVQQGQTSFLNLTDVTPGSFINSSSLVASDPGLLSSGAFLAGFNPQIGELPTCLAETLECRSIEHASFKDVTTCRLGEHHLYSGKCNRGDQRNSSGRCDSLLPFQPWKQYRQNCLQ